MSASKFNSKKELDNVFKIMSTSPQVPSEIMKLYTDLENKLIAIHEMGYNKGVEINKEIKNTLK